MFYNPQSSAASVLPSLPFYPHTLLTSYPLLLHFRAWNPVSGPESSRKITLAISALSFLFLFSFLISFLTKYRNRAGSPSPKTTGFRRRAAVCISDLEKFLFTLSFLISSHPKNRTELEAPRLKPLVLGQAVLPKTSGFGRGAAISASKSGFWRVRDDEQYRDTSFILFLFSLFSWASARLICF